MSSAAPLLPATAHQDQGDSLREVFQAGVKATNADVAEPIAQTDDDTDDPGERVNPLVAVVIGMAFMFGALALLLALG